MKAQVRFGASLVALTLLLASAADASAPQAPVPGPAIKPAPSLADALQGPAKEAYASARMLANNGDAIRAMAKYQEAYDLSKDPRLLYNMALCARTLRTYARMQGLLVRFEREMGTALTADDKADVDAALAAIRTFVGQVTLDVTPADAMVTVDGDPIERHAGEPLVLDLGKHEMVVAKPGFVSLTRPLTVQGGAVTQQTINLSKEMHLAHLVVHAPADAAVRVDQGAVTVGSFTGPLASGRHDILVSAPGKVDYQSQVLLRDDETRSVDVTLEGVHHAAIWPWVVGSAVVVAGAAVGGYFLFKPEDKTLPVPTGTGGNAALLSWRP